MENRFVFVLSSVFVVFVVFVLDFCRGHVELTYPPARTFSNDGSWASKTNCPVGKGIGPRTSVVAGSTVNITWKSSYPHRGGFKLEVLDSKDRPLMDLTPIVSGDKFLTLDPTTQNYGIRVPQNFECIDCGVRLLRQAAEWSPHVMFASCADVDFKKLDDSHVERCTNKGSFKDGHCTCQKTYTGSHCQYKDECLVDSDCGFHGHCVDIGGTTYPRRQCYCDAGWFGPSCDRESDLKTIPLNLASHSRQDLHENVHLYWRLLFETQEIEMVVVAKGSSYVALGWRPNNITADCKDFRIAFDRKSKQLDDPSDTTTTTAIPTEKDPHNLTTSRKNKIRFPSRRPATTTSTTTSTTTTTTTTTTSTTSTSSDEKASSSVRILTSEKISMSVITSESEQPSEQLSAESSASSASTERLIASSAENTLVTSPADESASTSGADESTWTSDESSHVTKVEEKSYVRRKKRDAEVSAAGVPLAPPSRLHAMDCTDVVVGSARDGWGRVADFYSRDQSTPQSDESLGGSDDLTAALAYELDGVTTIAFRKKLNAGESLDHGIGELPMHVVWARGQEEGNYLHEPPVLFEDGVRPFYAQDELKYHGTRHQRGATNVHFYNEVRKEVKRKYHGEWKRPGDCQGTDCEYRASWEFDPESDDINFTIFTKHFNSWTGIGFSKDRLMNNTDAIIGWVNEDGHYFMMDMWISGYAAPLLDGLQDVNNQAGTRNESGTTLSFSRKRQTGDHTMDLAFSDQDCLYMIFPYHGGHYNTVNKKLKMHDKIPAVSSQKVCIYASDAITSSSPPASEIVETVNVPSVTTTILTTTGSTSTTQAATSSSAYTLVFRLPVAEPLQKTLESNSDKILSALKEKIRGETTSVLENATGFRDVVMDKLERDSNTSNWLIATVFILVDRAVLAESNSYEGSVTQIITDRVREGTIGNLQIDPTFIFIQEPKETENDNSFIPNIDEVKSSSDEQMIAIYAIITAVCALGLLVFIQIVCTVYRSRHARRTRMSKEQLITNSGWKDYSTSSVNNYNYEPFLPLESEPSSSRKKNTPSPMKSNTPEMSKLNPRQAQHLNHNRRSESLSRLAPNPSSGRAATTNAYATHDRAGFRENGSAASPARGARELQPDFYFMPSQRRYTGDVIRVSVDYNNPNYSGKQ